MNAHFPCVHFCFSQYRAMTNTQQHPYSFQKKERLCSKRIIDTLFDGGSKSFSAYPLRAVFRSIPTETDQELVSVLVSVSKKHFKRAVKRNRAKRQIREAYRKNKSLIYEVLAHRHRFPLASRRADAHLCCRIQDAEPVAPHSRIHPQRIWKS